MLHSFFRVCLILRAHFSKVWGIFPSVVYFPSVVHFSQRAAFFWVSRIFSSVAHFSEGAAFFKVRGMSSVPRCGVLIARVHNSGAREHFCFKPYLQEWVTYMFLLINPSTFFRPVVDVVDWWTEEAEKKDKLSISKNRKNSLDMSANIPKTCSLSTRTKEKTIKLWRLDWI